MNAVVQLSTPKQQTKPTQVFTIVAFKYDQRNSILYRTTETIQGVQQLVELALKYKDADILSIRRVYECHPQYQNPT